jgi:hypothetical protein
MGLAPRGTAPRLWRCVPWVLRLLALVRGAVGFSRLDRGDRTPGWFNAWTLVEPPTAKCTDTFTETHAPFENDSGPDCNTRPSVTLPHHTQASSVGGAMTSWAGGEGALGGAPASFLQDSPRDALAGITGSVGAIASES